MIRRLRRRLFTVRHIYTNLIDQQRARVLLIINWLIALAMIAWLLSGVVPTLLSGQEIPLQTAVALALTLTLNVIIFQQIQTGRLRTATRLFVTILVVNTVLLTAFLQFGGSTNISGAFIVVLAIPLVAAGVLLNRRGMILVFLALLAATIYAAVGQSQNPIPFSFVPADAVIIDLPIVIITLGLILAFLLVFAGNLERIASQALSSIQERQWLTEFGAELGGLGSEELVLSKSLEKVQLRFEYVFGQIFLLDEEGHLTRTLQLGSRQIRALTREESSMSEENIIIRARRTGKPTLTSIDDALPQRSHLISVANVGIAVPVWQGEVELGVLDLQSVRQTSFSQTEVQTLLLVAEQIAISLTHARKVTDLERSLREQESANTRLQSQVSEYLQRERRGVGSAWSQYLEGRGKTAIGYNIEPDNTTTPVPANDIPDTLYTTLQQGTMQIETVGNEQIISVPITFRDQTLGAMSFTLPKDQDVSERQIEMARVVAERLALALENTRLFEQSQAQALRERKASEVSSTLIGATDVPSVLNLAAENFNEALGAVNTRIYIQPGFLAEPLAETTRNEELR